MAIGFVLVLQLVTTALLAALVVRDRRARVGELPDSMPDPGEAAEPKPATGSAPDADSDALAEVSAELKGLGDQVAGLKTMTESSLKELEGQLRAGQDAHATDLAKLASAVETQAAQSAKLLDALGKLILIQTSAPSVEWLAAIRSTDAPGPRIDAATRAMLSLGDDPRFWREIEGLELAATAESLARTGDDGGALAIRRLYQTTSTVRMTARPSVEPFVSKLLAELTKVVSALSVRVSHKDSEARIKALERAARSARTKTAGTGKVEAALREVAGLGPLPVELQTRLDAAVAKAQEWLANWFREENQRVIDRVASASEHINDTGILKKADVNVLVGLLGGVELSSLHPSVAAYWQSVHSAVMSKLSPDPKKDFAAKMLKASRD